MVITAGRAHRYPTLKVWLFVVQPPKRCASWIGADPECVSPGLRHIPFIGFMRHYSSTSADGRPERGKRVRRLDFAARDHETMDLGRPAAHGLFGPDRRERADRDKILGPPLE